MLSAAFAALVILLAAAPAHAAKGAKIKAAYPGDRDRDGHVDSVSLRWSKTVRGGRDSTAPFAVKVRGYRVTSVGAARGKSQQVAVAERKECDTGGSVRLSYRKRAGATTVSGPRVRKHKLDMRRFDIPTPRITCAVTLDADSDGRVDGVRITYSREVKSEAQRSGRFLFSVAGYKVKAVQAARRRFLEIDVAEHASVDSAAKPAIGYSRPSKKRLRRFSIRSGKSGGAYSGSYRSTRDGVSPQLLTGRTGDVDRDGLLDSMTLRFSEPVAVAGNSALAVLGMQVRSKQVSGAEVTLSLAENTARGDARPGAWIAGDGVTDLAGNAALDGAVTPGDAAPPVVTAAATQDTGGSAGQIDAVMVRFSEPVAHPRDAGGAYPFLIAGRNVTSVEAANGFFVQVRIAESGAPDTGERPSVRYISGAGLPVADQAGNAAAEAFVSTADAVAPVLLSAETTDADADGRIGHTVFRFSEDVLHDAEGSGSSFSVGSYAVTAAGAAEDDEITVTLAEKASADSGATPAVEYARDGVEDVRDAAGNLAADTSLTATDGARPVLLSATTADVDDDGRLDRLATSWSEPLTHADDTAAPFAVSASGFTVSRVRGASGKNFDIDLTEPGSYDTGSKPDLTYLGGSARIRDAAGLEPAQQTWSGLTADALDPRVVSATTGDTDSDGELDSIAVRFSESVVHAQEATPGSFTAGAFTILTAEAAAGDKVELKLTQSGTGDTGARPVVTYAPDGVEDVRDNTGNFAPAATIAQATDGARPVLLSAATADVDDDGRLDRVSTEWSEPLTHADDSTSPFPLSAEQLSGPLSVARVHAAAGQTLDVDLTEPTELDTGSAPDLTYTGGADPITDAVGLEPAQRTFAGVTADALPPRRVSTSTADDDLDGKLDAIEIVWSETVTGTTPSTPYTVAGRTLGANVSFSGATTRVPFAEGPGYDTHDTPQVSYDAVAGDLHDVAERPGDTPNEAPGIVTDALDKAAPILVEAETADFQPFGNPNGTIDAVRVRFSEPVTHPVDGQSPFSLNVAGRTEWEVEQNSGDDTFTVHVNETGNPDGGDKPNVTVQAVLPAADRIRDEADVPNEALPMQFTNTSDNVRPVLMSADLGEGEGGACTTAADPGIDGRVDCVRATWSEDVQIAEDTDSPFSVLSDTWTVPAGAGAGIPQQPFAETLVVPFDEFADEDRDRSGTSISYQGTNDVPVEDRAGKESLDGSVIADPACRDTGLEGNDDRDVGNPTLATTAPSFQRKCAFDDDWYRVETTTDAGFLEVATRPAPNLDVEFELWTDTTEVTTGVSTLETGAAGQVDRRTFSGLAPSTPYYLLVKSDTDENTDPQEGAYCVVFADAPDLDPGCGPLAGQIVFTEVGFGNDKFVEIKNDFDVPVDMAGAGAELVVGPVGSTRSCTLMMPGNTVNAVIDPDEHVLVEQNASTTSFGCNEIASLESGGERLELRASGSIDVVDFAGIIDSAPAAQHSLQFVEGEDPDADGNNEVATRWCRTFAADTKGAVGDGCDAYRINEVLWRPAAPIDGKAFVEIAGNIPALPQSELLGNWMLRGVNGQTGAGEDEIVLPVDASPRDNGLYVVADGLAGGGTLVPNSPDLVDGALDLASPFWTDPNGNPGPRGLQLLTPDPSGAPSSPCVNSMDAFGWLMSTGVGFSGSGGLDDLRGCPIVEGSGYAFAGTTVTSAARDSQSADSGDNLTDFCPQTPNPAEPNNRVC